MNKTGLTLLKILYLSSTMFLMGSTLNIQIVKASGTIYIRADGSIDPPSAPIQRDGDIYTFTANILDCIVVQKSNVTIDGKGYTVQGSASRVEGGVNLHYVSNVTIKNTNIDGFVHGVYLISASNNTVSGNRITNNELQGVRLFQSSNNIISGNQITNNNAQGIQLHLSSNNTLSGNIMAGNKYNFDVWGNELSHFMHSIDVSNLVEGKPVYYLVNEKDLVINSTTHPQVGYLALVNCTNITVEGLYSANNGQGLLLAYTNNSHIIRGTLTNNDFGVWFASSSGNTVSQTNVTNNRYGVWLDLSFGNIVSINNLRNNRCGIWPCQSFNNTLSLNNITNNRYGVWLDSSYNNTLSGNCITKNEFGVSFCSSSSNSLFGNSIRNNLCGIRVGLDPSPDNIFSENTIADNGVGVNLVFSSNNKFYSNNFINNTVHASSCESVNVWDNGYLSGGNYWNDYNGVDLDHDGLGDIPYVIYDTSQDTYPLMNPFDSEMGEVWVAYRNLLLKYNTLHSDFETLNSTLHKFVGNIAYLQESVDDLMMMLNNTSIDLQEQINSLNYTLVDLNQSMVYLKGQVYSLNSTLQTLVREIVSELNNIRNMMHVFIATTIIFVGTTVYLATRKKMKP